MLVMTMCCNNPNRTLQLLYLSHYFQISSQSGHCHTFNGMFAIFILNEVEITLTFGLWRNISSLNLGDYGRSV